jgi:hypothetical protein
MAVEDMAELTPSCPTKKKGREAEGIVDAVGSTPLPGLTTYLMDFTSIETTIRSSA